VPTTASPVATTVPASVWSVICPATTTTVLAYNVSDYRAPPLTIQGNAVVTQADLSLIVDGGGRLRAGSNIATYTASSEDGSSRSCNFTIHASPTAIGPLVILLIIATSIGSRRRPSTHYAVRIQRHCAAWKPTSEPCSGLQ